MTKTLKLLFDDEAIESALAELDNLEIMKLEEEDWWSGLAKDDLVLLNLEQFSQLSTKLRSPIASIMGYCELMRIGYQFDLDESQQDSLLTMESCAKRLAKLIDDLHIYHHDPKSILKLERCRVDALIHKTVKSFNEYYQQRYPDNFRIIKDVQINLPDILVDKARMAQVIQNLLKNALTYTTKTENLVIVHAKQVGDYVQISVSDEGLGISDEHIGKVFEAFYTVRNPKLRIHTGSGLGLHLAQQVIELQDGKIWVESEVDEGSIFHFTVPIATDKVLPESMRTILLLSDDEGIAAALKTVDSIETTTIMRQSWWKTFSDMCEETSDIDFILLDNKTLAGIASSSAIRNALDAIKKYCQEIQLKLRDDLETYQDSLTAISKSVNILEHTLQSFVVNEDVSPAEKYDNA